MARLTHKFLVQETAKYLLREKRFQAIATETAISLRLIPDAIALKYKNKKVTIVECKISRSDFKGDNKFVFYKCLSDYAYLCVPKGLIKLEEVPKYWGLLEYEDGEFVQTKRASLGGYEIPKNAPSYIKTDVFKRLKLYDSDIYMNALHRIAIHNTYKIFN